MLRPLPEDKARFRDVGGDKQDAMSRTEPQPAVPTPKLRWYQYRLRTLLLLVFLVATTLGLLDMVRTEQWILVQAKASKRICSILADQGVHDFVGVGSIGLFSVKLSRRDIASVRNAIIQDAKMEGYWVEFGGRDLLNRERCDTKINRAEDDLFSPEYPEFHTSKPSTPHGGKVPFGNRLRRPPCDPLAEPKERGGER